MRLIAFFRRRWHQMIVCGRWLIATYSTLSVLLLLLALVFQVIGTVESIQAEGLLVRMSLLPALVVIFMFTVWYAVWLLPASEPKREDER